MNGDVNNGLGVEPVVMTLLLLTFRIIWFMIFMSALGFFIYFVYSRIAFYLLFTMTVSVEVNFFSKMPFPAVTFCNQNSFKYSRRRHSIYCFISPL